RGRRVEDRRLMAKRKRSAVAARAAQVVRGRQVYTGPTTYEGNTRIYHKDWKPGTVFRGRVSWFGGPNDAMDNGSADAHSGIAFPSTRTRGGWFRVTFPNGKTLIRRQIDYGPADWVGRGNRVVDVNYRMLKEAGYTEANFPTDGKVRVQFLGFGDRPPARAPGAKRR